MGFMQATDDPLCVWSNATLKSDFGTKSWKMCLYSNSKDFWVSRTIKQTGAWEANLVQLVLNTLKKHADSHPTLLDIGANIGYYTLAAARAGLHVEAFEPSLRNAEMLRQSLIVNRLEHHVKLHTFALAPNTTTLRLGANAHNQGNLQHEHSSDAHLHQHGTHIAAMPLDSVMRVDHQRKPSFYLKMDVEGSECQVVRGMTHFLTRARILGANLEMQAKTRTCCKTDGWTQTGGFFHTLHTKNSLCPFTKFHTRLPHWELACNETGPWDLVWKQC